MSEHSRQLATANAYGHRTFDPTISSIAATPPPVEPTTCWQLWEARQTYFYQRCLGWLHGNQADAEDAFNTAALAVWRTTHEQMPAIVIEEFKQPRQITNAGAEWFLAKETN